MKAKFISISFTLKGQDLLQIKAILASLSDQFGAKEGKVILVHGFMPKEIVLAKGFSTELTDTLKELFPFQLGFYKNDLTEMRKDMTHFIKSNFGNALFIGNIIDGVKEEYDMYCANQIPVSCVTMDFEGKYDLPLSFGQKAMGITFNPGGKEEVNNIKSLCADVADELNNQRSAAILEKNGEKIAQFTLAVRAIQDGQMWGVKATTWLY